MTPNGCSIIRTVTRLRRFASLAAAALVAVQSTAAGAVARVYGAAPTDDTPAVTFYVDHKPVEPELIAQLRAARAWPSAVSGMGGSNTVTLSGAARGSSSAVGRLTVR